MAIAIETHAHGVARALGIKVLGSAVDAVVDFCEAKVGAYAASFDCTTLDDLRLATADGLRTLPITITSDEELRAVKDRYLQRRELGFATLEQDLGPAAYGQTIRLLARQRGERVFVSIIDARGEKAARACFTEWHEYAHLLTLTDPSREKFQRSHGALRPPEEALMDAIAARIGFLGSLFVPRLPSSLSFASIAALRSTLCPTASWTSLFSAIARVWPTPVVVVRAEMQVKTALQVPAGQGSFGFFAPPQGELRAVQAIGNDAARAAGFRIHRNMRVPATSVIARVFAAGGVDEASENLSAWEVSDGSTLATCSIFVIARATSGGVDALVVLQEN